MVLHLPTLHLISFAMLVMSAGAMTLFGLSGRVYRGFWWWAAAQWLLSLSMLLQFAGDSQPVLLSAAKLLQLQWPIVVLAGLRRFYARHEWPVSGAMDGGLLAIAFVAWLAAWVGAGTSQAGVFSGGAFVLHLYGAVLLVKLPAFRNSSALKALAVTLVAAAAVQAAHLTPYGAGNEAMLASALLIVLSALVMVYLGLLLSGERTETNLRLTRRKLRFLANMDTLTHVPNRRHFTELAVKSLKAGKPGRAALMMFDIDHFKQINDRLGHAVGDDALRQVGRCTRDTLREFDVAGRLGGDEFAVLLPDTTVTDAMSVAARIVGKLEHRQVAPNIAPLSLSFGVVQMYADESLDEALRRADQALYEAKRQGRSRAVSATGDEFDPVFGQSQRMGLT